MDLKYGGFGAVNRERAMHGIPRTVVACRASFYGQAGFRDSRRVPCDEGQIESNGELSGGLNIRS